MRTGNSKLCLNSAFVWNSRFALGVCTDSFRFSFGILPSICYKIVTKCCLCCDEGAQLYADCFVIVLECVRMWIPNARWYSLREPWKVCGNPQMYLDSQESREAVCGTISLCVEGIRSFSWTRPELRCLDSTIILALRSQYNGVFNFVLFFVHFASSTWGVKWVLTSYSRWEIQIKAALRLENAGLTHMDLPT